MTKPIDILHKILNLQETAPNQFTAPSHNPGWNRVYGGQVIAQSLKAATLTVTENHCHSLHCYFMRPGNPDKPITYTVDPIRDGKSFQTRLIMAAQGEEPIFTMTASFHKQEPGLDHQDLKGDIKGPDQLPPITELLKKYGDKIANPVAAYFKKERPFEMRPLSIERYLNPTPKPPEQCFWLRTTSPITGDDSNSTAFHQAALAYASDFTLIDTALIAHGRILFDPTIMVASLDHSIWFHRPFRIDEWLLYKQRSPNAFGARGLCFGQFYNQSGQLIASTAQEGLTRPLSPPTED